MAGKRAATTELNHDNWDKEDEEGSQDPGVFTQASEDDLRKRVIKKAVRRRGPEENSEGGPGSVFSGFGGFKAAAAPPAAAAAGSTPGVFDFLKNGSSAATSTSTTTPGGGGLFSFGKPANGSGTETGFTFVATKSSAPAAVVPDGGGGGGGFVFGKASSGFGALAASGPAKATFSFGPQGGNSSSSGQASGSLFGGSKDAEDNEVKTGSSSAGKNKEGEKAVSNAASAAPLNELTAFKASNKWTCGTCMVQNDRDKDRCVCCESPNPAGGAGPPAGASPAASGSSSSPSSSSVPAPKPNSKWTCSTCLVPNEADKDACVCCTEPRPGAPPPKKESSAGSGAAVAAPNAFGGFKLGTSGFTFGNAAATSSTTSSSTSGFTFNAGSTSGTSGGQQGFKFGSGLPEAPPPPPQPAPSTAANPESRKTAGSARIDQGKVMKIAASSKEFLANLGALNKQFVEWVSRHVSKNSHVLLEPCFKDYEGHLLELVKRFGGDQDDDNNSSRSSSSKEDNKAKSTTPFVGGGVFGTAAGGSPFGGGGSAAASATPTGFTFAAKAPPAAPGPAAAGGFFFGVATAAAKSTEAAASSHEKPAFSFGSSSAAFGSGSIFGQAAFGAKKAPEGGDGAGGGGVGEQDDDEDQPPKVEVKQVAEDDAVYSVKCKLFYKKGAEFVDKGVGMLHLKKVSSGGGEEAAAADGGGEEKVQMLVRAETNLGNVLLNIRLNKQIGFVRRNNNLQFVCVPNPPIPGLEPGTPVTMLVRVKGADVASVLEEEIKKAVADLAN